MLKLKLMIFTMFLFFMAGCTSSYKLVESNGVRVEVEKVTNKSIEYLILEQDRVSVSLYKDPTQGSDTNNGNDLNQKINSNGVLVDTAGNISLPLIGKVKIAGLSQSKAADKIANRYKKYMNSPAVYVEVLNKRLFVLGEVKKPGVINIDKEKMTLFEALAHAGDLTDSAQRNEITILSNRANGKGMQLRKVDLTNFDRMNYASLMLRPNDIVYVKPNNWKAFRVASDDITSPFVTITKIAAPFVTLKYLFD